MHTRLWRLKKAARSRLGVTAWLSHLRLSVDLGSIGNVAAGFSVSVLPENGGMR